MRSGLLHASVLVLATCLPLLGQNSDRSSHMPVALRELVPASDPLARQDLTFDGRFAELALRYLHSPDPGVLDQLATSPAAAHLLEHARNFDYDVPKDSTRALVKQLLSAPKGDRATCEKSLAYFTGPMLANPQWVNDTLGYLPQDFRFHGSLFLIYGYDIGVAFHSAASLNCGHPHFAQHSNELTYYAIHELHHVGFMSYQPPPRLADIKTCRDLLHLVEYSTQLEGMAVLAAYQRRRDEHALADDSDYVALEDAQRMQHDEELYFADLHYLEKRGNEPADADAWAVITRMSSGERLWYRVGAKMAQSIERTWGRPELIALIRQGPGAFRSRYEALRKQPQSEH